MINYCIISDFVFLFTGQLGVGAIVGITIAVILPTLCFLGLVSVGIFCVCVAGNTIYQCTCTLYIRLLVCVYPNFVDCIRLMFCP